jgi:integrase
LNYGIAYRQFESYITTALGLTDDARHFTDERVVGFMNWMHEHRANSNTVRARLSALTALAKYGARIKDGRSRPVAPVNPLESLERPKKRKPPEKFLLPDELRAFLKVPRPMRDSIVRDVLVDTGLRVAEMCAADVGDLFTVEQQTALQVTRQSSASATGSCPGTCRTQVSPSSSTPRVSAITARPCRT